MRVAYDALQCMLSLGGAGELEEGEEKWEGDGDKHDDFDSQPATEIQLRAHQTAVVCCFPFLVVNAPFKVRFVASVLDYASRFRNMVGLGTGGAGSE